MKSIFTEQEINAIYWTLVKKNNDYLSKYDHLNAMDILFLESTMNQPQYEWNVRDFTRVRTVLDFRDWMQIYSPQITTLAYTWRDDPEIPLLRPKKSVHIYYDPTNHLGDLHSLQIKEEFDFFLFNQTLEHLYDPFLAVRNIWTALVPGGLVFTSVPTINIPHSTPFHFNGFTPMGLCMLFMINGFKVLELGQWGNYEYISKLFLYHAWPGFSHLTSEGIKNEEKNVVNCWILAQKIL